MTRLVLASSLALALALSVPAADWPQWRGPNRDGISKETGLLKEWPKDGLKLRWKAPDLGTGYSTPAVVGGKVFLQTTKGGDEFATALDEKTGKPLWTTKIGVVGYPDQKPSYPGTRSTPTVDGDRLYCLSSGGQLTCLDTAGKLKWQKDYDKDFEGKVGNSPTSYNWAYSESVLVDGDAVVGTPGGATATLVSLNKMTGAVIWKCAVPGGDPADYASIVAVETGGVKQYVQFLRKGVVGVDAKTGKFLWRYDRTAAQGASMFTPVAVGNKVFTSSGRGTGGALVELTVDGGTAKAKELYFDKALSASIGGAVVVNGLLFGSTETQLFCADFETGQVKWNEPTARASALCFADGRLYVRTQPGEVILVEPSGDAYAEKGRFKQPDRGPKPAWPHPVVANGGLYLRDWTNLFCYEVRAAK